MSFHHSAIQLALDTARWAHGALKEMKRSGGVSSGAIDNIRNLRSEAMIAARRTKQRLEVELHSKS